MQPKFHNTPEDCQWLRETALKGLPAVPLFRSFVLHGNEDSPERVDLYVSDDPLYSDSFVSYVMCPESGEMVRG